MELWFDATAAALVAAVGFVLGSISSRLPKGWWTIGYFIPLAIIVAYAATVHYPVLAFVPPFKWLLVGRRKFALIGFVAAMVLTTPLSRLPKKRDRILVSTLMGVVVALMGVWPFLAPIFNREHLSRLETRIGADGVCRQGTSFTCGPAAAVTALRKLGFAADEGRIAILSFSSEATGTPPDILADALRREYGKQGLVAEYRVFRDLAELKQAGLTLVVVKFGVFVDHYLTILDVTDSDVVVGDPLNGYDRIPRADFLDKWRYSGIVLRRAQ